MPTSKLSSGQKPAKSARKLASKASFSRLTLLVFCAIFAGVGAYIIWRSFAAPPAPTVYVSPSSQILAASTSFSIQVRENSGATSVNAVQANLTYDTNLLTFVSINTTGTAFSVEAQNSGGAGVINLARGSCGGCAALTGDQLIATINFTTKTTTGSAAVAFSSGTALVNSVTNTDILGSLAATGGGTYSVDATAPTVSITAPANNATLAQGSTVNVTANAADTGSSVSKVEVYIDGALAATDNASPYSYAWNTTGLALGSHTVQAKSYDTVNNVTTSSLITVTLADQTAPATPGSFRTTASTSSSITLAWNASTDNVAVASYRLSRNGTQIATLTPATLSYNDTGLTPATTYNYTLTALDGAGNTSTAATLSPATSASLPGDCNSDGHVNIFDVSILISNFGSSNASCDFNHDGVINILDVSIQISHYGT